ncbi:MAG: protein kinase [Polyangiaceae bacterium]|nr:protein kinase [Polyangiaceae bacterium]
MSKRDPKRRPARKASRPAVPPRRLPPPATVRFGEIIHVVDQQTGEPLCLEVISPFFYPTPQEREALRERLHHAFERLRERGHPAFPPYRDTLAGGDGILSLILSNLEGETLRTALERQGGPLARLQACAIARSLLDALDALHGLGMVHRLVSPGMLMLKPHGGLILLESGLADALLASLATPTASISRTFFLNECRAPEEASHRVHDPRTDLFSAGAVLYEMLSGQKPPPARPSLRAGETEKGAGGPRIGLAAPALAGSKLESVVARALSPAPDDRFPTARAFLEALVEAEADVAAP